MVLCSCAARGFFPKVQQRRPRPLASSPRCSQPVCFICPCQLCLPDGAPQQRPGQQKHRCIAPASQGRRCWVAKDATGCPWRSSCKSPRTLQKCKLLITRQLTFGAVRGGLDLCSPSTRLKVNHLCIRYLWFESVRGDLQEGHFYASRCHLSLCSSTKMPILCSKSPKIGVPDPKKAQKPQFCARQPRKRGFETPQKHTNAAFSL